jgi:hypothetical protein
VVSAVIYPYERKDGKLWLLMAMSESILELDDAWSLEDSPQKELETPVPTITVKRKPKVTISK